MQVYLARFLAEFLCLLEGAEPLATAPTLFGDWRGCRFIFRGNQSMVANPAKSRTIER